jgi:peptide/nickel transport system permease protein
VSELLGSRLAVTVQLSVMAFVLALLLAVILALVASRREGGVVDRVLSTFTSALLSAPSFVVAVVLSLIFTGALHLLPATGWVPLTGGGIPQNLRYAALPALSLALPEMAFFYRVIRSELSSTMREDFVLVARTKGLGRGYVLARHVLRPSLNSLITMMGMSVGRLLGGALIVETFFAVPGIGYETLNAVSDKDMNVLQAIITLTVAVYVVVFIIVDLAYAWADPRVRAK